MKEKSVEEFICQRVEYHYQDSNEDYMIGNPKQLAQSIKDYYLAKLPAEKAKPDKNDICISCKKHIDICNCELNYTWNDCIAEMRKSIEES